jgi:hypothetical protein
MRWKMSNEFSVKLEGAEAVERVLKDLSNPRLYLQNALKLAGERMKAEAKEYPPELPNQVYVRQYVRGLRGHWTYRVVPSLYTVSLQVGNNMPYAPKVMDAAEQAWIHQGRWRTIQEILADNRDFVVEEVVEAIEEVMERALKK